MIGTQRNGSGTTETPTDFLKSISGRPVVVMVNGNKRHFVCVSGIKSVREDGTKVTLANVQESDFLLMEPASPELKPMDTEGFAGIDGPDNTRKRSLITCKQAGNRDFGSHNGKNQYLVIAYGDIDYSSMSGVSLSQWSGKPSISYKKSGSAKVNGNSYDVSYLINTDSFQKFYEEMAARDKKLNVVSNDVTNPLLVDGETVGLHPFM